MTISAVAARSTVAACLLAPALLAPALLFGQEPAPQPPNPQAALLREASRLDVRGLTGDARVLFQRAIDSAATPAARASAQRAMAMSFAFGGDCDRTVAYEQKVIAYWKTRELDEPQNAFYQQGEMANEAARVCIDAGQLDTAEKYYRMGSDLGNNEPEPRTHPRSLWDYRLAHALGRLAARRGNKSDAHAHVANARRSLDGDTAMAAQQERFFPYLVGYVALYLGDLDVAERELTRTLAMRQNQRDPFMHVLMAMVHEKRGQPEPAKVLYEKAFAMATGHNPPAAFSRPFARKKLGLAPPDSLP